MILLTRWPYLLRLSLTAGEDRNSSVSEEALDLIKFKNMSCRTKIVKKQN